MTAFFFASAIYVMAFKTDTSMVAFYLFSAASLAILWSSTYTTLSNGLLTTRVLFFVRRISIGEISRITPHKMSGKRGNGTVVNIFSRNGTKITLQPDQPFLASLRAQAPQADYLL
jgi:hypothetical protein